MSELLDSERMRLFRGLLDIGILPVEHYTDGREGIMACRALYVPPGVCDCDADDLNRQARELFGITSADR